ncbi:1,2-phenylacetyl-CoA epoxidase subunit PaaC [Variovorax sp. PCZ-1]|uniref:1,2-phenylacetyl-CoA epoxidase subunit PaaC n=1 Tax=Variovorax sp. PCZ-1 TaxID=2835533 RepID=UPI001BCDF7E6|nr:1,2-phenylacetyl-CoA epoxidase subunit PaaC [Variovorax sp. PCZ-1]MBS7808963.1 phenylacetate-CoA oxygenase subunit PaaC [Variovorax sp. PCZ-1]
MSATYLLHLADNALILGQRNAEWCGHGPVLEEDIAMANIGLDCIGQARMLYQHAAGLIGGETTEDTLAYFRSASEFRNYTLLELPHQTAFAPSANVPRDYSITITRNFLYSTLMNLVWPALQASKDDQLAAIAAKSSKEVRYHLRHSTDWMLRLGDGTALSHNKMQAALDYLMPYTQEFFTTAAFENEALRSGIGISVANLKDEWQSRVATVVTEATLQMSPATGHLTRGKEGLHSEHLSYLLAEMQSLAREHPGAVW